MTFFKPTTIGQLVSGNTAIRLVLFVSVVPLVFMYHSVGPRDRWLVILLGVVLFVAHAAITASRSRYFQATRTGQSVQGLGAQGVPSDEVRSLLQAGRRVEALALYRLDNPQVQLKAAKENLERSILER